MNRLRGRVRASTVVALLAISALGVGESPEPQGTVVPALANMDLEGTGLVLRPKGPKQRSLSVAKPSAGAMTPDWMGRLRLASQTLERKSGNARLVLTVDILLAPPRSAGLLLRHEAGLIPAGPWAGEVWREIKDPKERVGDRSWRFDRGPKAPPSPTESFAFVKGNAGARLHMYELGESARNRPLAPQDEEVLVRLARALAARITAWQKAGSVMPPMTKESPPRAAAVPPRVEDSDVCPPQGIREGPPLRPSPPLRRDVVQVPDSVRQTAMDRLKATLQPAFLPGSPASLVFAKRGEATRYHSEREGLTPTVIDGIVAGPIAVYVEIDFKDRATFIKACQRVFKVPDDVVVDGQKPGDLVLRTPDGKFTIKGLTDSEWAVGKRLADARERRFSVLRADIHG